MGYDIFIGFAVVGLIGLISAVLLALATHFLHVEEDETVVKVRACLPGANCGACGYAGCDEYAKAVAAGAKTNLCIPGGAGTAAAVAEVMGVAAEAVEARVAMVHCNGHCEATEKKAIYDGIPTCQAASMLYAGPNACRFGCLGCGDCAVVCPADAICIKDGIAHVDPRTCIGCGLCAETCPKKLIDLVPKSAHVAVLCSNKDKGAVARKACANACIGCMKCAKNCPEQAITVVNNVAVIDYSKCNGCGTCEGNCPMHCIKLV